jgi:hypothetical protein
MVVCRTFDTADVLPAMKPFAEIATTARRRQVKSLDFENIIKLRTVGARKRWEGCSGNGTVDETRKRCAISQGEGRSAVSRPERRRQLNSLRWIASECSLFSDTHHTTLHGDATTGRVN